MSKTMRDRLDRVSKRIDTLNDEANQKFRDANPLYEQRKKLYAQILLEEKLLAGSWAITHTKHHLGLEAVGDWNEFPKLRELLKPDYHENYPLWDDMTSLHFDDGMVTLRLPHEIALRFIRDHGIVIDLSNLTKRRDDLVVQLETANALLRDMGKLTT